MFLLGVCVFGLSLLFRFVCGALLVGSLVIGLVVRTLVVCGGFVVTFDWWVVAFELVVGGCYLVWIVGLGVSMLIWFDRFGVFFDFVFVVMLVSLVWAPGC